MFPIVLCANKLNIILAGDGKSVVRRLGLLQAAGAGNNLIVYSTELCEELKAKSEVITGLPSEEDIKNASVLMLVGLGIEIETELAELARKVGTLVNVEDKNHLCDFYFSSTVRRGDLLLTVSTAGQSPTLAKKIKSKLSELFPEIWKNRVAEIGNKRDEWRASGLDNKKVEELTNNHIKSNDWL
jgi:precorrin-2 dehydrogenase/sirohydrochlorin ferrochelatase